MHSSRSKVYLIDHNYNNDDTDDNHEDNHDDNHDDDESDKNIHNLANVQGKTFRFCKGVYLDN